VCGIESGDDRQCVVHELLDKVVHEVQPQGTDGIDKLAAAKCGCVDKGGGV
jgi:hypothetical protein